VAPAPHELDEVQAWNRRALEQGRAWLFVRPFDGRAAMIGPLVLPGETACYECTLLRRGANLGFGNDMFEIEAAPVAASADACLAALVAALAAHLALRWAVGHDTTLPGVLHVIESRPQLTSSGHAVLRVPRCPACSPAGRLAPPLPWHAAEAA
jgi:bacteriocin biosynthesis cyclodehydratase domain-containing protein